MEDEYKEQLREQLKMKRRLLHEREMQLARMGISADPSIIFARDDLKAECAEIEARLGIVHPQSQSPRTSYNLPPIPERDFAAEQGQARKSAKQADITHHQTLLRTHRQNLAHYRAQAKAYGGIELAPPITRHGMREGREGITQAKEALRALGVQVDDLPGDE